MTNPEEHRFLPSTFASIRCVAEHLEPEAVSSFFRFAPTLSYLQGDPYKIRGKAEKKRDFGLWLFRTEGVIFSRFYKDHLDFILFNFLFRHYSGSVREFLAEKDYKMVVSLFWHGKGTDGVPDVDEKYIRIIEDAGGRLEVECDVLEEDADRAA